MAEAGSTLSSVSYPNTSNISCRYYMYGQCREMQSCRYLHDGQPSTVCKYFLKGQCSYGVRCRYDHVRSQHQPKPSPRPPAVSQPESKTVLASRMVTLKKRLESSGSSVEDDAPSSAIPMVAPSDWVNAAEFVPGQPYKSKVAHKSYLEAAGGAKMASDGNDSVAEEGGGGGGGGGGAQQQLLCPYLQAGECEFGAECAYVHGDMCEYCGQCCLHPTSKDQRALHKEACLKQHEKDMEYSFQVQRSKDKACGICMELVMEKTPVSERRFGILSNCKHVFCLSCIRKWRSAKQFENKIIRACPECRVNSNFVTPSLYWVEDHQEKLELIEGYKTALSAKPCKYFKHGCGECPFAGNCFYQHAYFDGTKAKRTPPRPRRRQQRSDGTIGLVEELLLWNFLTERDHRWFLNWDLDDEMNFLVDWDLDTISDVELSDYDSDDS
ncbi:PREDICTED: probable E3 ubiquitin-protein ligase makorin-1 [Priapulus caudatus]|uniref:RING-type E3 ubiquitin transferase n=1 Tax=Priapulus caudatus TaxID=37621 RepID=A0ABM1EC98_PRICU|nr:PREDICTED: probable E3 ubiquitin-protein ligase makorin-1 [Priapulus caudatus]